MIAFLYLFIAAILQYGRRVISANVYAMADAPLWAFWPCAVSCVFAPSAQYFRALPSIATVTGFVFTVLLLVIPLLVNEFLIVRFTNFLKSTTA
jgi:hypothetical protein